jgi:hypothetical protein
VFLLVIGQVKKLTHHPNKRQNNTSLLKNPPQLINATNNPKNITYPIWNYNYISNLGDFHISFEVISKIVPIMLDYKYGRQVF